MRQTQSNRRGRGRSRKAQNPLTKNYESTGPDVKIRGTAAHISEKYNSLARDALTSSDIVRHENYLQHAEHYNRIIMEAQQNNLAANGHAQDDDADHNQASDNKAASDKGTDHQADGNNKKRNNRRRRPDGQKQNNANRDGKHAKDNHRHNGARQNNIEAKNGKDDADAKPVDTNEAEISNIKSSADDAAA